MPNSYNNNGRPTITIYTPLQFSNPDSRIQATSLSIRYFNRLMVLEIAPKVPGNPGDTTRYNHDNAPAIYLSYTRAKLLHDAIVDMLATGKSNVNIETNKGMIQVSNGAEYGSDTPCVVFFYTMDGGVTTNKAIYQMKDNYKVAYNFTEGNFSEMKFGNYEMDTFLMILEEYWKASSYAIAATVREASMYAEKRQSDVLYAIATKVGARTTNQQQGGQFLNNSQASFNNGGSNVNPAFNDSGEFTGAPQGYERSSFEDIANSMGFTD